MEVLYFGLIISIDGVWMDSKKIKVIINWQELKNIKDIKAFIKFTNFYQQFIDNFFALVLPLIAITRKDKAFIFNKECKKAFTYLKVIFITVSIFQHFNPNWMSVVKANLSNYVTRGILS